MVKVAVVGGVDKRPVVYPLLQCLRFVGKTLIISDDPLFRRFDENFATDFEQDNLFFAIRPTLDNSVISEVVRDVSEPLEYIIVVANNFYPDGFDKTIALSGVNSGFDYVDKERGNFPNDEVFQRVFITTSKVKGLEYPTLTPSQAVVSYMYNCEDHRRFLPLKDGASLSVLTALFSKVIGVEAKTLSKLLERQG